MLLEVSKQGIDLIKGFEGFRANAYWDEAGKVWTIGYGETQGVKAGDVTSEITASIDLRTRLDKDFVPSLLDSLPNFSSRMLSNELDALASLAYNIGSSAFHGSTLAKLLERGEELAAAEEFAVWNHAGGAELRTLTRRRAKEMRVFLRGY